VLSCRHACSPCCAARMHECRQRAACKAPCCPAADCQQHGWKRLTSAWVLGGVALAWLGWDARSR
jgi:hypothetical protein